MTEVEKKGIGKAKVGLVVSTVLIVILAITNVWSYTNLQNQINSLNDDKINLQTQVDALTTDKNNLQNEVNSLKASWLHEVNREWSDHHPWFGSTHISISGAIFNSGTNSAYNVAYTIRIYDSSGTLLKSEELLLGTIIGKSYKNYDTDIGYSGNADYITTTLTHD